MSQSEAVYNNEMNRRNLWVLGCAQNCCRHIEAVFANLERLRSVFKSMQVLILENDSTDETVLRIRQYGRAVTGVHARSFQGLNQRIPAKTERLAHLRNGALSWLRSIGEVHKEDVVLILDLDEVNAEPWDLTAWTEVLEWWLQQTNAAAVFANQLGPYYDMWALRHPKRCPMDLWQAVFNLHNQRPDLNDEELIKAAYEPFQFTLNPTELPEEVDSAFGGLGFYKANWLLDTNSCYSGLISKWLERPGHPSTLMRWQVAEHVNFHAGLRAAGATLWIHPALINWHTDQLPDLRPNPQSWRHLSV